MWLPPFIKGEISKILEEELAPQPVETKIVNKKKEIKVLTVLKIARHLESVTRGRC